MGKPNKKKSVSELDILRVIRTMEKEIEHTRMVLAGDVRSGNSQTGSLREGDFR